MYYYRLVASPVGELKLVADKNNLVGVLWENDDPQGRRFQPQTADESHPVLAETWRQLQQYFAGERREFTLPLAFVGTEFQKKVWHALLTIPCGETRSYGDIARQIGHPQAVRAVGAANGRNPLSIVTPCHRVIGTNGKLTGFAGGLTTKAFLLDLEKAALPMTPMLFDEPA